MRIPLIIGNWKLNGNRKMIKEFFLIFSNMISSIKKGCRVVIIPPIMYLDQVKKYIDITNKNIIYLGAQNVDINLSGAFTGDISANMLKDIGAKYILIGHSERRIFHQENDELIAKKFAVLKSVGLIPVICIGENREEYEKGYTETICKQQINVITDIYGIQALENVVIAYEPIWAIGTGVSAIATYIQSIHKFIRNHIAQKDVTIAKNLIIQYGGSVTDLNAAEILIQPDIDGLLIGTASLNAKKFANIIKSVLEIKNSIN
ncbi:MAG: triose-phosphate isomerase [Candidatus Dasytiphilus stammeri]